MKTCLDPAQAFISGVSSTMNRGLLAFAVIFTPFIPDIFEVTDSGEGTDFLFELDAHVGQAIGSVSAILCFMTFCVFVRISAGKWTLLTIFILSSCTISFWPFTAVGLGKIGIETTTVVTPFLIGLILAIPELLNFSFRQLNRQ
jgi:hypothetical protein